MKSIMAQSNVPQSHKMEMRLQKSTPFRKWNGRFNKDKAICLQGQFAGMCYEPDGMEALKREPKGKTLGRIGRTLEVEHSTPYEHINITFEATNISKALAMLLNGQRQNATSEKSARYTPLGDHSSVSEEEFKLYWKWMPIFKTLIKEQYGKDFDDKKTIKLAQENARYFLSVHSPLTKMVHTIPFAQINRVATYIDKYINQPDRNEYDKRLKNECIEFLGWCDELNLLDERAMTNAKDRSLTLFGEEEVEKNEFGHTYAINYKGSQAQLAQAHRHRTLEYEMLFLDDLLPIEDRFFIPPIIKGDQKLVREWLSDMASVAHLNPQGELVSINEYGSFKWFVEKLKERLCTHAQLEIMLQSQATLWEMYQSFLEQNHQLLPKIEPYLKGARCTFPDYTCMNDCKFSEGKTLKRKI